MQTNLRNHLDHISYHQKSKYITIIYDLFPNDASKSFQIELNSESTIIREISSNDFTITILHPSTNFSSNTFSISSSNIVILLEKLDNVEWNSLRFKFNNEEILIEKWFLTKENIQKCTKILENETKWNKTLLSPEIQSMQAVRDKDGIIVQIKARPSSLSSAASINK
ncbi:2460_t:CDS:2 [Funneliformis geosporum]|uniref:2460_t:CDS:1 n=1 Tax=Funneliformis geosporum TaxID=1117311 RepID=A0A9W4X0W5_9GLOM|nr:2460_t:CDS:2 [Funneliformis geosporum]